MYQDFDRTEFQLIYLPPHYPSQISKFFTPVQKRIKKAHCTRLSVISSPTFYARELLKLYLGGHSEALDFPKNKYPRLGRLEMVRICSAQIA